MSDLRIKANRMCKNLSVLRWYEKDLSPRSAAASHLRNRRKMNTNSHIGAG